MTMGYGSISGILAGIILSIIICLSAARSAPQSYAEITASNYATISDGEHNLNLALKHCNILYGPKGQTANVHFVCPKCNHDESTTLTSPTSQVFSCDCKNPSYIAVEFIIDAATTEE